MTMTVIESNKQWVHPQSTDRARVRKTGHKLRKLKNVPAHYLASMPPYSL